MDQVPLIAGESGEKDCGTDFINDFMNYADTYGVHYLMWAWIPSDCAAEPALIADYQGTPTPYGEGFKTHLDELSKNKVPTFYYSFPVYTDVRSHWVDYWTSGGAVISYNETQVVHTGMYSIKFQPTLINGISQALYFQCWGCINTTVHRGIEFYINGGTNGNQQMILVLSTINDKSQIAGGTAQTVWGPKIDVANLTSAGTIQANQWQRAYLDLSTVPEGVYDGIQLLAYSDQPAVYFDDIKVWDKRDNAALRLSVGWLLVAASFVAIFFGL